MHSPISRPMADIAVKVLWEGVWADTFFKRKGRFIMR